MNMTNAGIKEKFRAFTSFIKEDKDIWTVVLIAIILYPPAGLVLALLVGFQLVVFKSFWRDKGRRV